MTLSVDSALERLAPPQHFAADWADVLGRVGELAPEPADRGRLLARRRRPGLVAAALAATLIVLVAATAVAAVNDWSVTDWWFLGNGAPAPVTTPVVVKSGSWDGKGWELVAYRSTSHGICFAMTPSGAGKADGFGGGLACGGFSPVAPSGSIGGLHRITFLSGSSPQLPTYIVGPVVDNAVEVVISFANGAVIRTPTFDAPASLGALRFYAARVPESVPRPTPRAPSLEKLVGLNEDGQVVACLTPRKTSRC